MSTPNDKRRIGVPTVDGIRRIFGVGDHAYRDAKQFFFAGNPNATQAEIEAAVRVIAKACRV